MRFVYGFAYLAALVSAAGCGRVWPEVNGFADPSFLDGGGGVRKVAIVPVDVQLGVAQSVDEDPQAIATRFEGAAQTYMQEELARRGYIQVASEDDADAVLSLGGFVYAGNDNHGAEVVGAVIAVVLIVGIIAILASGGHHHGHGGGGVAVGHARHGLFHCGRAIDLVFSEPVAPPPSVVEVPDDGGSHSLLELRLLERGSGRVLWRAQADLPANPGHPGDVHEAMARLAASLPLAR